MTLAFQEWRLNTEAIRLQQVRQSLRPHNTPQWYLLSIYIREWFFSFPEENETRCIDAETLLQDMQARLPGCDYNLPDFMIMLHQHYGYVWGVGVVFTRADIFAPYVQARSQAELDEAKRSISN